MKKKAIFTAVLSIVLSISLALPTQARTVINSGEIRDAQHARNNIQRIYNNGGLVFKRTRDITYHYDTNHIVTTRVEYGNDVVAEGNNLAAELGINPNSYSPNHSERGTQPWQLAGWKIGDNSASAEGILSQIACNNHMDVYAVWKKDCSSSVNWNGGTGSGGSMSGYAYYNNGNLTKFACKLPTSASRANYTFTDFSGNPAGATVYLTDKSTFICNWKAENIYKIWTGVWCEGTWNPVISGNNISVTQVGGRYYNNALFIRSVDGSPITSISYDVAFTGNAGGMFIPDGDTSRMACTEAQWGGHVSWVGSCNYVYLDYCGNPGTSAYWTNFYINGKPASFTW